MHRHRFQPGQLVPVAQFQARRGGEKSARYRGVKLPREMTADQFLDVARLLKVRGLNYRHIAVMCDVTIPMICRHFPFGSALDLPPEP